MTENERIKQIRKELDFTLEKFGEKVGVTRASMSNIENGNRNVTEQMRKSICREFHVDYIWLTTGKGEPFVKSDISFYEKIDRIMAVENDTLKSLIMKLVDAPEEDIAALKRCIEFCSELTKKES